MLLRGLSLAARVGTDAATQEVMLASLTRVLHSSQYRLLRPDLGQHVKIVGDSIWTNDSNMQEFNNWAENIWIDSKAKMHGIVEVYTALLKWWNKIITLQSQHQPDRSSQRRGLPR
eukprot:COSAG06_NODE_5722_length_3306_cov_1.883692_2_plen_116_part_00